MFGPNCCSPSGPARSAAGEIRWPVITASDAEAALPETVFHDVHQDAERHIHSRDLRGRGL